MQALLTIYKSPNCAGPVAAFGGVAIDIGFKKFAAVYYDLGANKHYLIEANTFLTHIQIEAESFAGTCTNTSYGDNVYAVKPGGSNIDLSAKYKPPFFLQ